MRGIKLTFLKYTPKLILYKRLFVVAEAAVVVSIVIGLIAVIINLTTTTTTTTAATTTTKHFVSWTISAFKPNRNCRHSLGGQL